MNEAVVLPFCFLPSAYTGAEAARELVPTDRWGLQAELQAWAASLPLPQAKGSAAPASETAEARKGWRSQISVAETPMSP